MNDRITVTLAVSVTVDPNTWYAKYGADPGVDLPGHMLAYLRTLPTVRDVGGKVQFAGLARSGSRHCRQTAQHRAVVDMTSTSRIGRLGRHVEQWLRDDFWPHAAEAVRQLADRLLTPGRMPNEPSGNFL